MTYAQTSQQLARVWSTACCLLTPVRALQEVNAPWQPDTDDQSDQHSHAFIVAPDAPVNPVLYWIGHREGDTFAIDHAKGPYRCAECTLSSLWERPTVCSAPACKGACVSCACEACRISCQS